MLNNEVARELRDGHTALKEAARPLVAKTLAAAFFKEGDDLAEHTRTAMNHRVQYLATHVNKIPRTELDFMTWEGKRALCDAIALDTMMNVQDEMTGGDDSRADYMPDGIAQIQKLTDDSYDGNGFLWYCINNLYRCCQDVEGYTDEDAESVVDHITSVWDVYMQDCTSGILYDLSVEFHAA